MWFICPFEPGLFGKPKSGDNIRKVCQNGFDKCASMVKA